MKKITSLLFLFFILASCSNKPKEASKNFGDLKFSAIAREDISEKETEYYLLKLEHLGGGNAQDIIGYNTNGDLNLFNLSLRYFSFEFQNDIKMKIDDKEYPCTYYLFERTYDLTPYINILIAFDTKQLKGDRTLLVNPKTINSGKIPIPLN